MSRIVGFMRLGMGGGYSHMSIYVHNGARIGNRVNYGIWEGEGQLA